MILKNFITDEQLSELLEWSSQLTPVEKGIDPNFAKIGTIPNPPACLDVIRTKCANTAKDGRYLRIVPDDFILDVPPETTVNMHVDGALVGYTHTRFVILLQKPEDGGELVHIDTPIPLDVKDCYVLDIAQLHGMTKVEGDRNYLSMVYTFEIAEE